MHICDLTTLYIDGGEGGVNTYLTEKARYLAHQRSYRHTIVVPGRSNARRALFGSTVYTLQSPRFFYNPHHRVITGWRQVQQLLLNIKPDIVEVDCVYFLGHWAASALAALRVPLVGFYHTHLPSFYARPLTQRFGRVISGMVEAGAWAYVAYCMKPLDRVLVASSDVYGRLVEHIATKVEHVPLGVNLELFCPRRDDQKMCHGHRPVILYVGRLSQEKDLEVLFEAFRLLNRRGTYQLRIVGDGPLRARTEKFVRATPHAMYAGSVAYGEQLAALYASADVLAMPSRNETFGLAILEALASGLPVVAVDQGGPSNLLCPQVGVLAAPGDAADLAEKLAHVLSRHISAQLCRKYAEQHFSWAKTFVKLLDIYDNLHRVAGPLLCSDSTEPGTGF